MSSKAPNLPSRKYSNSTNNNSNNIIDGNNNTYNQRTNVSQSRKPIINADLVNTPRSAACVIDYNTDNYFHNNNKNVKTLQSTKLNGYAEPTGEVIRASHRPVEYVIYNSKIPSIYGINYQMAQRAKEAKARRAAEEREFAIKQAAEMQCEAQQAKLAKQRERSELLSQLYKYNVEQSARRQEEQRRAKEERVKYERALLAMEQKDANAESVAQHKARLARQHEMQAAYEENIRNKSASTYNTRRNNTSRSKNVTDNNIKSKERYYEEEEEYNYLFGDALARDAQRNAQVAQRAKEVYKQNVALADAKRQAEQAHRAEEMRHAREVEEIAAKELNEWKVKEQQRKRDAAHALSNEWKTIMDSHAQRTRSASMEMTSTHTTLNHNKCKNNIRMKESNSVYLGTQRQYEEDAQRVQNERQHCRDLTEFNKRFAEEKKVEMQKARNNEKELARISAHYDACEAEALRNAQLERKKEQQQAMRSASERAIRYKEAEKKQVATNNNKKTVKEYDAGSCNFYNGFSDAERSSSVMNNKNEQNGSCVAYNNRRRRGQSAQVNKRNQKEFFEELHRDAERRREAKKREEAEAMALEKRQIQQQQMEVEHELQKEKQKRATAAAELKRSLEAQIAAKRQQSNDNSMSTHAVHNNKYNLLTEKQQGRSLSPDIALCSQPEEPEKKILYRCPITHRLLPASAFDFGVRHRYANNESVGSTLYYEERNESSQLEHL